MVTLWKANYIVLFSLVHFILWVYQPRLVLSLYENMLYHKKERHDLGIYIQLHRPHSLNHTCCFLQTKSWTNQNALPRYKLLWHSALQVSIPCQELASQCLHDSQYVRSLYAAGHDWLDDGRASRSQELGENSTSRSMHTPTPRLWHISITDSTLLCVIFLFSLTKLLLHDITEAVESLSHNQYFLWFCFCFVFLRTVTCSNYLLFYCFSNLV